MDNCKLILYKHKGIIFNPNLPSILYLNDWACKLSIYNENAFKLKLYQHKKIKFNSDLPLIVYLNDNACKLSIYNENELKLIIYSPKLIYNNLIINNDIM